MAQKITFALMDCKDSPVVGIDHKAAKTEENFRVLEEARLEYLQRVEALQKEISDKYTSSLANQEKIQLPDYKTYDAWRKKYHKDVSKYDDILYYT